MVMASVLPPPAVKGPCAAGKAEEEQGPGTSACAGPVADRERTNGCVSRVGWRGCPDGCPVGGCAAVGAQADSAAALLAHGTRALGTVTGLSGYHMDVRFVRDGKTATARINLNDSSDVYHKGDRITVVYDPAHPDRARTIREDGQSQGSVWIMVVLLVAGAFF